MSMSQNPGRESCGCTLRRGDLPFRGLCVASQHRIVTRSRTSRARLACVTNTSFNRHFSPPPPLAPFLPSVARHIDCALYSVRMLFLPPTPGFRQRSTSYHLFADTDAWLWGLTTDVDCLVHRSGWGGVGWGGVVVSSRSNATFASSTTLPAAT